MFACILWNAVSYFFAFWGWYSKSSWNNYVVLSKAKHNEQQRQNIFDVKKKLEVLVTLGNFM